MKEVREEGIKQYGEIQKNSGLPSLEAFEEEFECRIQAPALASVMSVILDKIGQSIGHVEVIFQPARMADAIESKFHTEKEKTELFNFYKEALAIVHEAHLSLYVDRKKRFEMIKKMYEFYIKKLKPVMQKFLGTQTKGWQSKEKAEDYKTYFG